MKLSTTLAGKTFSFRSVKEVLAKANEEKSGDILAGIAAGSDLERVAAKEVHCPYLPSRQNLSVSSDQQHWRQGRALPGQSLADVSA